MSNFGNFGKMSKKGVVSALFSFRKVGIPNAMHAYISYICVWRIHMPSYRTDIVCSMYAYTYVFIIFGEKIRIIEKAHTFIPRLLRVADKAS